MTSRDRLDDLIGGLSASQVMYDYPRNTAGEPMDPVLFVKWDAMLDRLLDAGVTFLDEERLARALLVVDDDEADHDR